MNESDLACFWPPEELDLLRDAELKREAEEYRDEVLLEWEQVSKVVSLYPDAF